MGLLVEGKWVDKWYKADEAGRFVRPETQFRSWVRADGSTPFTPDAGRYHLYVARACPWAHRTVLMRNLLGLQSAIDVSIVHPDMGADGWEFRPGEDDCTDDAIHGAEFLRDVYRAAAADYTGRVTVPILWDKETSTIVNNESREIVRMLNVEFSALHGQGDGFAPAAHRGAIDEAIDAIYEPINNGVYRSGFAVSQGAYEDAVADVFEALDHWDAVLGGQRYMCGEVLTEADWFLFTTLVRFDAVYFSHFKCNIRRISDYPHLSGYLRELYQVPGVRETTNMAHIKRHYFWSHESINPHRVVPVGPELDLDSPHGRG